MVIAYIITWLMIAFYFALLWEDDDDKMEKRTRTPLRLHSLNVILEGFPQSVIAKVIFTQCTIKDSPVPHLVPWFDVFSGLQSISFIGFLCWYYCAKKRITEISIGLVFSLVVQFGHFMNMKQPALN